MTFKKLFRAGLVGLAVAALLGLVAQHRHRQCIPTPRWRRRAAPAAPAAAAPAAAPRRRLRGHADPQDAVLEKCTPNSGDTAWMLTSVALVLMMTIPGLALFYGGMVRKKNVRRHGDDELRHHLPGHRPLGDLHLQPGLHRRARRSSAASSRVPAGHPERHREGHRQSQSARRRRSPRPSTSASR